MQKTEIYKKACTLWINKKNINLIIQKITGLSKGQLFLNPNIDTKYQDEIDISIKKLNNGEPLEYIINNAVFYSLDFYVDKRVLIPRDDTEILVDKTIECALSKGSITLIDVWTWSSCIPISTIKNSNNISNSFAVDVSKEALEVSKKNIAKHKLDEKIIPILWNLLNNFLWDNKIKTNKNVIITANLPYIKDNDYDNVDKNTHKFEPNIALYWWRETWFELYEKLIKQCVKLKKQNSLNSLCLIIEIWFDQKNYSESYLVQLWLSHVYYKDNSQINRCIKIIF